MKSDTWKRLVRAEEGGRTSASTSSSARAPPSRDPGYSPARGGGLAWNQLRDSAARACLLAGAGSGGDQEAAPPLLHSQTAEKGHRVHAAKAHAL